MEVNLHPQEIRLIIRELLKAQQHLIRFQSIDESVDSSIDHLFEIIQIFERFEK